VARREVGYWFAFGVVVALTPVWYDVFRYISYGVPVVLALTDWPLSLVAILAGSFAQRLISLTRSDNATQLGDFEIYMFAFVFLAGAFAVVDYASYPTRSLTEDETVRYAWINVAFLISTLLSGGACVYRSATAAPRV
jgi:hypothetical protein